MCLRAGWDECHSSVKWKTYKQHKAIVLRGHWEGLHSIILRGTPKVKDLRCPFNISRVVRGLIYLAISGVKKKNTANKNSFLCTENNSLTK